MQKTAHFYFKTGLGKKKLTLRIPEKKEEEGISKGYMFPIQQQIMLGQIPGTKEEEEEDILKDVAELRKNAVAIPDVPMEKPPQPEEEDLKVINIKYPLIPREPKRGERVFAYAHIFFDKRLNELVYVVAEPPITGAEKRVLEDIKEFIQEKLDVSFAQIRKAEAVSYIIDLFKKAVTYYKVRGDLRVLEYYVIRDFIGLEAIEPFMQDKNIEDVSCDGLGIPIYVYHRNPKLASLRTNISFAKKEELDSFVNKLAERCGKNISVAKPLLDGTLPDGSRIQATLGSDIARHGSNFTIRMFTEKPLTPVDLVNFGTTDLKTMAYLWFLVEHEASILIAGGTASGKTSLLNVLSLFIKPQLKIVSIEDTAELRLPHAHWIPEVARTVLSETGKVDMYELLKESLRQRPDYIVVGEVRGKEAYVLFQQMAVGHAGLATIHAENFVKLVDRLTTEPISLPVNLVQNLDVIVFVRRVKQGRRYSRRISSVLEVLGYSHRQNKPITSEIIKWEPVKDIFANVEKSPVLRKIANNTGLSEGQIQQELLNRAKIIKWMAQRNIRDYRTISAVINLYYLSPDFLMNRIETELT